MKTNSVLVWVVAIVLFAVTGCSSADSTGSTGASEAPSATERAEDPSPTAVESAEEAESPEQPETSAAPQKPAVITISDFEFDTPDSIAPGQPILVKNEDTSAHTVTAEGDGGFDVAIDAGATAKFTAPEESGEYSYFCTPHPFMKDTLVIE